jgi:hypothetical protein
MFFLVIAVFTFTVCTWGAMIANVIQIYRNSRLSPEVEEYCDLQYRNAVEYHHIQLLREYNEKFLPEFEGKSKLLHYQDFLRKIREKKVLHTDFINIQDEIYRSSGLTNTSGLSKKPKINELRNRIM